MHSERIFFAQDHVFDWLPYNHIIVWPAMHSPVQEIPNPKSFTDTTSKVAIQDCLMQALLVIVFYNTRISLLPTMPLNYYTRLLSRAGAG